MLYRDGRGTLIYRDASSLVQRKGNDRHDDAVKKDILPEMNVSSGALCLPSESLFDNAP